MEIIQDKGSGLALKSPAHYLPTAGLEREDYSSLDSGLPLRSLSHDIVIAKKIRYTP